MKNPFNQLCVWPGVTLGEFSIAEFEAFMLETFGVRAQFHADVLTKPDLLADGSPKPGTGGRSDLFFFVHDEDIAMFAIARLQAGIRWWEDVIVYNDNRHLYSEAFLEANPPTW